MEKVFIADDEQSIREGLKKIIDWEAHGFEVCGDAANGEDALKKILALNPSLVIIDIRMPKKHGIEVIESARAYGFNGKIIILSGYSDFKYAQAAIRFGVEYYLTKPVDEDELIEIVDKVYEEISNRHQNDMVISHYREKAKKEILEDLIKGRANIDLLDIDALSLRADRYQVVIYEQFLRDSNEIPYQFSELLRVTNNGSSTFEHLERHGHNIIILKGEFALSRFERFLYHYRETPPQKGSPLGTLFLAYGCIVDSLSNLPDSYNQARQLIDRRFFCDEGQHTLSYEVLPQYDFKKYQLDNNHTAKFCQEITDYLQAFNRQMLSRSMDEITEYLYNADADVSAMKLFLTDLFLQVKESITRTFPSVEIPFPRNSDVIEFVDKQFYLYEIISYFTEQFEGILGAIGSSSRDSILDDIIFYINNNYQNNIKLESIAPLFGYNSAYLGKIFSKTVGESFNNYVDHVRIEHAKELVLENKLKVYEISEQVGYKNVDYFHKKFKKYVGVSPAEYRKKL